MSRATWLLGLLLFGACTAPPKPQPAEAPPPAPAPVPRVHVGLAVPDAEPAALDAAVQVVESALARVPAVEAVLARADEGRADVVATLAHPTALTAVRDALAQVQSQLPPEATPTITRSDDTPPVFALALPPDGPEGSVVAALERTAGVARVEVCGGSDRILVVDLDRTRLAGVAIDRLIATLEAGLAADLPGPLHERLMPLAVDAAGRQLRDIAALRETRRPRPCAAFNARGPVLLFTVRAQFGADPTQALADARAHALGHISPTLDFFADSLPTPESPALAVLALELEPAGDAPAALSRCLAGLDLPPWALMAPGPAEPDDPVVRARLLLATTPLTPLAPVLSNISSCTGVKRTAVLAPLADADHAASVVLTGADPATLAALADAAAAQLAALDGVTALRVLAPRPPAPVLELELQREALVAHTIATADVAQALRLAHAPLPLHPPAFARSHDLNVELDLADRTGPIDQLLNELHVHSPVAPVPLAPLVRARISASTPRPSGPEPTLPPSGLELASPPSGPELAPRYRIDREPAAALDLRLRRAADRERVQKALAAGLTLPPGVRLALGPGLPALDP